jgi:kinesin family protein 3/17
MIENQANLQKEEKDRILDEIRKREEAEEKAKTKQQKLISRLKKMEEKMVVGSQAIKVAKKQQKELKKTQKALEKEQEQQAQLDEELRRREEELMLAQKSFGSLQEELEYKTARLERLWQEYSEVQDTLNSCQEDFDRERNDMFDTIYELTNQLKLKQHIIDHFIPPEEYKKYEKVTVWNDEYNDWVINHPAKVKQQKKESKRPQSAVGMKRPTSEYSRIAKGLGDLNPRYKFDNILQLDLDMPERTTEDYEGVPSMKV